MIVLDTHVVSEAMKPSPDAQARLWLNDQIAENLYLSSVTPAELLSGIACLPDGRRKEALTVALDNLLKLFGERVLSFDVHAAAEDARLAARARAGGRGFPTPDGCIAAIAVSRGFRVASRDIAPLEAASIPVINPWIKAYSLLRLKETHKL